MRQNEPSGMPRRLALMALALAVQGSVAVARPVEPGACCLLDGTCITAQVAGGADCTVQGGDYQGDDTACATTSCPAPGACCLPDGLCAIGVLAGGADCLAQGGAYLGDGSACDVGACRQPGWNWVDNLIELTKNEPAWWSASTGLPKGVSPFTVLDPGGNGDLGRPAPDGSGDRVVRGYIVLWAVDANGREIRWNHLSGGVTTVNYRTDSAWSYNAWSFPAVAGVANGESTGDPGVLNLDGTEYVRAFDMLLLDFWSVGPRVIGGAATVEPDTELVLLPVSADLRQESAGPVATKAVFSIWNQNEVKFSGLDRCVRCWDQAKLRLYEAPNHFLRANLQTDNGRTRIDAVASMLCDRDVNPGDGLPLGADPRDVVSEDASLLGLVIRHLRFSAGGARAASAANLHGLGLQPAVIRHDPVTPPPEANASAEQAADFAARGVIRATPPVSTRVRGSEGSTGGTAPDSDRVSATVKGSLLILASIELRWTMEGEIVQDAFVELTNDYPEDVRVQMYFVNGDPPLD